MKPPSSSASPASASQDAAPGLRHPDQLVEPDPFAVGADNGARLHPGHGIVLDHGDATVCKHAPEMAAHRGIVAGQHFLARDDGETDVVGVAPALAQQPPQAVLHGERHLDACRAAADGQEAHRLPARGHALHYPLPALRQPVDGLDRRGVLGGAGYGAQMRRRTDVDRGDVVGDRRPRPANHAPFGEIETGRFVVEEARAGEAGERPQIDMALRARVVAGDEPGQHAGIRRLHVSRDQGDAQARHRPHAEAFQDMDVGVPAADEHEVFDDRRDTHDGDLLRP